MIEGKDVGCTSVSHLLWIMKGLGIPEEMQKNLDTNTNFGFASFTDNIYIHSPDSSLSYNFEHNTLSTDARWDIVAKQMKILEDGFKPKMIYNGPSYSNVWISPKDLEMATKTDLAAQPCNCPRENFSWNGLGCQCGGI